MNTRPIYLDYQATTPLDPRVRAAMAPYFEESFGNPHSSSHLYGWEAEEAVEQAREQIAALLHATSREIVFTSGATEANNLAIKGAARFLGRDKSHIVTSVIEHKCVLESCADLEGEGFDVTYLGVDSKGLVDPAAVAAAIGPKTALVSIMAVNNEIGTIQPIAEIGAVCRARGVLFHTDAAQAAGKIPLDVQAMGIGLLSLSGHKMYGPKGIGALYVRRRPRVRLVPLFSGGGQERGLRSGTLPTPLCVGLGVASGVAAEEMATEGERLCGLRARFLDLLGGASLAGVHINGGLERRIPGNLSLSFEGVDGASLLAGLRGIAVSSGSACSSAAVEPSYVLQTLGVAPVLAQATLRIGFGRLTTEDEVDRAASEVIETVRHLRAAAGGALPAVPLSGAGGR